MKPRSAMAVALVAVLGCDRVMALTGNEFLDWCETALSNEASQKVTFTSGYCVGAIQATSDIIPLANASMEEHRICLPPSTTNKQIIRIVVKDMQEHPSNLHLNSTVLTIGALQRAFPCKK